ncbi:MAG: hypothetical protein WBD24_05345 [Candidatus Omnitrophota bacterium]
MAVVYKKLKMKEGTVRELKVALKRPVRTERQEEIKKKAAKMLKRIK